MPAVPDTHPPVQTALLRPRIHETLHQRKQFPANPVASVIAGLICRVLTPEKFLALQVLANLLAPCAQERTNSASLNRMHAGQPAKPASSKQVVKNRLRLILLVMGKRYFCRVFKQMKFATLLIPLSCHLLKCLIAQNTSCLLLRHSMFPGIGAHIPMNRKKRDLHTPADFLHPRLIAICLNSSQTVVDMNHTKRNRNHRAKLIENRKKTDRICPSRHCHNHPIPRFQHMSLSDKPNHLIFHN